jgi:hypothetical protein
MQIILQPSLPKFEFGCKQRNNSFTSLRQSLSTLAVPALYYVQLLADMRVQWRKEIMSHVAVR